MKTAFNLCYEILLKLYNTVYPLKNITLSNYDPKFVTPHIKLRLRNRLMHRKRRRKLTITAQINRRITRTNAAKLSSVGRGGKEVWQAVRQAAEKSKPIDTKYPVDAETLNQHFANISTDKSYQMPLLKATVDKFTTFFSEEYVFHLLDTVRPSVTGLDKISSWFLRISAPLISVPTAYIFNTSHCPLWCQTSGSPAPLRQSQSSRHH